MVGIQSGHFGPLLRPPLVVPTDSDQSFRFPTIVTGFRASPPESAAYRYSTAYDWAGLYFGESLTTKPDGGCVTVFFRHEASNLAIIMTKFRAGQRRPVIPQTPAAKKVDKVSVGRSPSFTGGSDYGP
jgi:hypothetical protein